MAGQAAAQRAALIPVAAVTRQLPFDAMDPSTTNHWQWPERMPGPSREAITCVLWTLHHVGTLTSDNGRVAGVLTQALRRGNGPYRCAAGQPRIYDILKVMLKHYGHIVECDREQTRTFALGLAPGVRPDQLPQPDPYAKVKAKAPERAELVPASARPEASAAHPDLMPAVDALAAIANFVESALRMAGVDAHDVTPDERLDELMADNRRLQRLVEDQGEQLVHQRRETEVLRRALAKRNGTAAR